MAAQTIRDAREMLQLELETRGGSSLAWVDATRGALSRARRH